jgi:hypothetical protein
MLGKTARRRVACHEFDRLPPFSFFRLRPKAGEGFHCRQEKDNVSVGVKNPVLPHGPSSKEKAILAIHPLPLGWAPALPSGASWLFHVTDFSIQGYLVVGIST